MADLYLSAKQKTARARELIETLEAEIEAFDATEPWERRVETDPEGLVQEHSIKLIRLLPGKLADITKETAEILLVALDHAAFAASKAAGSQRLMAVRFPIGSSIADLDKVMTEICKGMPPMIADLIRGLQPFKGGNDLIWGLGAIAANESRDLIVPVGSVDSGLTFINNKTEPRVRWDAKRREIQLGIFPIHGTFNPDIDVRFTAAFAEIETLAGRPVLPVLKAMTDEIERVIAVMERKTSRLDFATE